MNFKSVETSKILCEPYPQGTAIAKHLAIFAIAHNWENRITIKPAPYYFGFESDYSVENAERIRSYKIGLDNVPYSCCTIHECPTSLDRKLA